MKDSSMVERFESHVDRTGEHHLWTGSPDPRTGTGQFRVNGKQRSTQRAAWELQIGPLPAGVRVRACPDDPRCVRIDHLAIESSRRDIAPTASLAPELDKHMTVSTAFPLYLTHLEREGRADTTIAAYRSIYRRWLDAVVGTVPVNALSEHHIALAVDHMADAVPSAATTAKYILRGLSEWAADQDL